MSDSKIILEVMLSHISAEIRYARPLDPDVSIQNQMDGIEFDELDFIFAMTKFEIDQLIDIPEELYELRFTFRQLAEGIATVSKVDPAESESFLTRKRKELSDYQKKLGAMYAETFLKPKN